MASNNSSSTSLSVTSSPTSVAAAANAAAAAAAATTAAMVSSSLYMPQTYSFLSPETFETLVEGYINQLHIRKRNKALINQQLANDCLMVLTNPENTAIFNPKFRWWVRKHFVFTVVGELRILMDKKNGKPVCVREQLYDKVCYFHHIIGHGGRDKTFAAITKSYSKVPAELVSLFTKNCQTCLGVRKYSKNKRPILNEFEYPSHQQTPTPQPQSQPQHCTSQQQQQQQQYHHHVQQQQQQQQQASHHPHLQLTCNTTGLGHYGQHSSQSMHGMMTTKTEHGTISPISPMMHHSGSGFFGSNGHLHSAYSQAAAAAAVAQSQQHHQQQQQQLQQQHHAALASHLNMSMSLSDMSIGGHLNTSSTTTDDSPSILSKLELHQLMHPGHHHQSHHHHSMMSSGLHSPTDLPEHHFLSQEEVSPEASSVGDYSPTLSEQYLSHNQQQQQQQQQNDYANSFSSYSAALSLSAYQQNQHHLQQQQQQQQDQSTTSSMSPSPILSQAQFFQKQIQHEHHRFQQQQQQHRFLPEGLMGADLTTTSTAQSAVPSMHITTSFSAAVAAAAAAAVSSIPTPTSASPLSSLLDDHEDQCHEFSEAHQHQHVEMTVADL